MTSFKAVIVVFHSLAIIYTLLVIAMSYKSGDPEDTFFFYAGCILGVQTMTMAFSYLDILVKIEGYMAVIFQMVIKLIHLLVHIFKSLYQT